MLHRGLFPWHYWLFGPENLLFWGGCPGHWRVLSSIPGPHTPDARSSSPPVVTITDVPDTAQCPLEIVTLVRAAVLYLLLCKLLAFCL